MSKNTSSKSVRCVKAESVPLCLRHGYEGAALSDAKDLTDFIQESIENMFVSESSPSSGLKMGLGFCFYLLHDKLAIASGELPFPVIAEREASMAAAPLAGRLYSGREACSEFLTMPRKKKREVSHG